MDANTVRRRMDAIWASLPTVFTVGDILVCAKMSKDQGSTIRRILEDMVDNGLLFRSVVIGRHLGRRPSAWSKERTGRTEHRLVDAVREVLPALPLRFSLDDLLQALGMSPRTRQQIQTVLDHLVANFLVVPVSEEHRTPGRPTRRWSANPQLVAQELSFRVRRQQAEQAILGRMSDQMRPWDPLSDPKVRS